MSDDIFQGLPPPSTHVTHVAAAEQEQPLTSKKRRSSPPMTIVPPPALKSAFKRDKPPEPLDEVAPQKHLRFRTTVDATEAQVIEAIKKITSHIKNPSKFSKASKLAIHLIQAGSVKPENSEHFFALLDAAMSSPTACNEPSLRADYHALFSAVQDVTQCFTKQQRSLLSTWMIRAVMANDLYTDDSFVYSKVSGKIKDAISSLPAASPEDDSEEAVSLAKDENLKGALVNNSIVAVSSPSPSESGKEAWDPFGLEALLPCKGKIDEMARGKKLAALNQRAEEEHNRFIKAQREALLFCLEIAARRYKVPWCQTVIDLMAKHAFDHLDRFTLRQREAIEKLWASIKEQRIRRKQGKSVTGKLDMNAFEWLQEKYSHEKISIRHSVGGGGERRAEQWLG